MLTIAQQPNTNLLYAAYRPVWFVVDANQHPNGPASAASPVVYADLYYWDGTPDPKYFGTVSCTRSWQQGFAHFFYIDLQDKCQELLNSDLNLAPGSIPVFPMTHPWRRCFVKFRESWKDGVTGAVSSYGIAPVAETYETDPVAGTGVKSNDFWIVNSAIQHDEVFDLAQHTLKYPGSMLPESANRLSHRPYPVKVRHADHDVFAFKSVGFLPTKFSLVVKYKDGTYFTAMPISIGGATGIADPNGVYHANGSFKTVSTMWYTIPWQNVAEYWFIVFSPIGALGIVLVTQHYTLCNCDEGKRIFFLNALGGYDSHLFEEAEEVTKTTSTIYQRTLPPTNFPDRMSSGLNRFQPDQVEVWQVRTYADEAQMNWLKELAGSTKAYVQRETTTVVKQQQQGQGQKLTRAELLPIVINDFEITTRKSEDRYSYEVVVTYTMANPRFNLRH